MQNVAVTTRKTMLLQQQCSLPSQICACIRSCLLACPCEFILPSNSSCPLHFLSRLFVIHFLDGAMRITSGLSCAAYARSRMRPVMQSVPTLCTWPIARFGSHSCILALDHTRNSHSSFPFLALVELSPFSLPIFTFSVHLLLMITHTISYLKNNQSGILL